MKIPAAYQRKRARIEIIPLIDIMFFLLATFVVVSLSMIRNEGITVRLPTAQSAAQEERNASITVSISQAGEIYLDKDKVALPEMRERLGAAKRAEPELAVFINGDERADFGIAVGVLDQVRMLGIAKVSVQTVK
ncbi:MAG TPA: biopolymer transporter ExbD [Pseudomonadales bacterium]|nr:biopolymer transporter ExbD [Pseudomonadales bacterium]